MNLNEILDGVEVSPATPLTTPDATHPSHKKVVEAMVLLQDKLSPWVELADPTDPVKSAQELANTAFQSLQGITRRFSDAPGYPDIHLPNNWPRAARAALELGRRTLVVLQCTNLIKEPS